MLISLLLISACANREPPRQAGTAAPATPPTPTIDLGSRSPRALDPQTGTHHAPRARNVILMINDGAGWGTWDAAAYWQYGSREGTPYAGFPVKYAMTTYPLNNEDSPTHDDVSRVNYDAGKAWDTRPSDEPGLPFEAYEYLDDDATDSAASGTAMASGIKTYQNAINVDNHGRPVEFITLLARAQGRATGVVTSVPFSHATPAAFGASSPSRKEYHGIARQMLHDGKLDLIIGTGGPGYNANGTPCAALARNETDKGCDEPHEFMAESDWRRLTLGRITPAGASQPWKLIRKKHDFEALASGRLQHDGPLLGLPEVAGNGTLQQGRQGHITGVDRHNPSGDAFVKTVPTLRTMTEGALHYLGRKPNGFFMMVEGGATDRAAHTSDACKDKRGWNAAYNPDCKGVQRGRLIEETADFNDAVAAVVAWVERHSSWDETLLIVTTDHDNSMPYGPDADRIPFQPVKNNGKGRMPGFSLRPTGDHSNALVPLWARGRGSEGFARRVRGRDGNYARHVGLSDGSHVDNTDVHAVMKAALTGRTVEAVR